MKVTIVYDNEVKKKELKPGWGFSCLVETESASILFDTGADSPTLLHNMRELDIDPKNIGTIVISHAHGDHTGGLSGILKMNENVEVYIPNSFGKAPSAKVTRVKQAAQISENVFSTGELEGIEQSLAVKTDKGILVIVGCSHPGVGSILKAALGFGNLYGIVGGFHGFRDFNSLSGLALICPCHCTQYKEQIRALFPERTLECGAGMVIEL